MRQLAVTSPPFPSAPPLHIGEDGPVTDLLPKGSNRVREMLIVHVLAKTFVSMFIPVLSTAATGSILLIPHAYPHHV
jgi:hypothetical protein